MDAVSSLRCFLYPELDLPIFCGGWTTGCAMGCVGSRSPAIRQDYVNVVGWIGGLVQTGLYCEPLAALNWKQQRRSGFLVFLHFPCYRMVRPG